MTNGARRTPVSWHKTWLLLHAHSLVYSLGEYCRNPVNSILASAVIGISLALPGGFYLFLENIEKITEGWSGQIHFTAFLQTHVDDAGAAALVSRLRADPRIEAVTVIPRSQALAEYKALSGYPEAIALLDDNPLPTVLVITPKLTAPGADRRMIAFIEAQSEVEVAQYDQQWIKRLYAIIDVMRRFTVIFSVFVGCGVLLIVSNTIRLAVYNRREEIEIIKLFGGGNSFIRRPFLYSGLWYGLGGALIAWGSLWSALKLLEAPVRHLAHLYASDFGLAGLSLPETSIMFAGGALLGSFGSWISLQRHLRDIEPV